MKEDVLEQVVDDYLQFGGYLTTHNVRFKPRPDHPEYIRSLDAVASDIDVLGFHPKREGIDRVVVVTCKAWQTGFDATAKLAELRGEKKNPKRATWHHFRELWVPKWAEAFRAEVFERTGAAVFDYRIAVTALRGDSSAWTNDDTITANLPGCTVGFLTLEEMWSRLLAELTTTPAPSDIGRIAQLLKAAGLTASTVVAPPAPPLPGSDAGLVEELENEDPAG
jgi:hypothetical protein